MEFTVFIIVIVALIGFYLWFSGSRLMWDERTSKKYLERLQAGMNDSGAAVVPAGRLISGMPDIFKEHATAFVIDDNTIHIHDTVTELKIGAIPRASITGVRILDESFHLVDMSPARMQTYGEWAMMFPKHRLLTHSFLCISWQHNNVPCETVFEFTTREEAERAREASRI